MEKILLYIVYFFLIIIVLWLILSIMVLIHKYILPPIKKEFLSINNLQSGDTVKFNHEYKRYFRDEYYFNPRRADALYYRRLYDVTSNKEDIFSVMYINENNLLLLLPDGVTGIYDKQFFINAKRFTFKNLIKAILRSGRTIKKNVKLSKETDW